MPIVDQRHPWRSEQVPEAASVFDNEAAAIAAVNELMEAGFDAVRDISVIAVDQRVREPVPIAFRTGVGTGVQVGTALGALLGAAGATVLALGGPVGLIAAGPIVAALEGAYLGGASGYLVGVLAGLGTWDEEADFHATHIESGEVWVGVHADPARVALALALLKRAGGRPFERPEPVHSG